MPRGREQILGVHTRSVPLDQDVDLETIACSTPGMVGADLRNLVNEAALLATHPGPDTVDREISIIPRGQALGDTFQSREGPLRIRRGLSPRTADRSARRPRRQRSSSTAP